MAFSSYYHRAEYMHEGHHEIDDPDSSNLTCIMWEEDGVIYAALQYESENGLLQLVDPSHIVDEVDAATLLANIANSGVQKFHTPNGTMVITIQ